MILGEVHVRADGDQIHFMMQHTTGIELYGILFDQLLGRTIDIMCYQPYHGASIRFLTPPPRYVTDICGWEAVISDPSCLLVELKLKVGDYIGPLYSSSDRIGFIVARGATTQEAIRNAECLAARVQIHVQEERVN